MTDESGQHGWRTQASWYRVEEMLAAGQPAVVRLSGQSTPRVDYLITSDGEVSLHVELASRQRVPRSPLPLIRIDEVRDDGRRMARIRLTQQHLLRDFHDLINAIAHRVIGQGRSPEQAFLETVRAWGALLETPRLLSPNKRIGIFGELLVLRSIAEHCGWEDAIASWKGPEGEEHDFGLQNFDAEVKTTASERHVHRIHGLGQLTPTGSRPLWVVSLQVTRGGAHGKTLTDLTGDVRAEIAERAPRASRTFESRLAAAGWFPEPGDDERWAVRNEPLVLPADGRLPRLDEPLLSSLPREVQVRVNNIAYDLDLTGLRPVASTPSALDNIRLTPRGLNA